MERVERVPFFFKFQISSKNLAFSHHTQPHAKGFETPPDVSETSEKQSCPLMVQLLMGAAGDLAQVFFFQSEKQGGPWAPFVRTQQCQNREK